MLGKEVKTKKYSKFQEYVVMFNNENSTVHIDFSKNELLKECYVPDNYEIKESTINNTQIKIFESKSARYNTKINGRAYFKYKDYNFKISVYNITNEEFINIIKSVINEILEINLIYNIFKT